MLVTVRNIKKDFHHGGRVIPVLRGIDLEIEAGEMVSVEGASGVGKSTLLHVLGTLDRPTAGHIWFENEELTELPPAKLAHFRGRNIGFVFQAHHLLPEFGSQQRVVHLYTQEPERLTGQLLADALLFRSGERIHGFRLAGQPG